jgi:hypothetical protein
MWFACNKGLTVYDGYEWNFLSVNEGIPMANYIKDVFGHFQFSQKAVLYMATQIIGKQFHQ